MDGVMDELKVQAMLAELEAQRNLLGTRCAQMAAELASAIQRIQALTEQVEKQAEELKKHEVPADPAT